MSARVAEPCPRCGGPVPDEEHQGEYPGALSRWDNRTEVCSRCGSEEAVAQWMARDATAAVHPVTGRRPWVKPPADVV